eukprot:16385078-Heterocapsa_arctica.AAC.1
MPGLRAASRAPPPAVGNSGRCRAGRAGEMCPAGVGATRGSGGPRRADPGPARSPLLLGPARYGSEDRGTRDATRAS